MPRKVPANSANGLYSVHPAIAYAQAIIANLPANTGKSLAEVASMQDERILSPERQILDEPLP